MLAALLLAAPAWAADRGAADQGAADKGPVFPALTGRVVDEAGLLPAAAKAEIAHKSKLLEDATGDQLVVAIVPTLQGYPVEEYGYQLGRAWNLGQKGKSNGVILLVMPNAPAGQRKVRVEVGYGLEPVLTDALSRQITSTVIIPRFKANDIPGGVAAGVDAIIAQLRLPEDQGRATAVAARKAEQPAAPVAAPSATPAGQSAAPGGGGVGFGGSLLIFAAIVGVIWFMRRRSGAGTGLGQGIPGAQPSMWGSGGGGGFGSFIAGEVLGEEAERLRRGRDDDGGFFGGGGGFGGGDGGGGSDNDITGGGGSFGGGGASDSW